MDSSPKIIASNYEILEKIGAGGKGVVYLGRHRNLDKLVVLKADKRTQVDEEGESAPESLSSLNPETLRQEVDALKDLNHTYIPHVYDYVEEDGVVYTVMDYIEGESLDKPLSRGESFPQAQVIKWARELLEALDYLHTRPNKILHSDIKPANIMLTPQGDIRLIDFNIALILGTEKTVRVGGSYGYASPEHYGVDFSSDGSSRSKHLSRNSRRTDTEDLSEGASQRSSFRAKSRSGSGKSVGGRSVLVDEKSDIYGLGATLYHLLTGERPAKDAKDVIPITKFKERRISAQVAKIVTKAMNPNPDLRYQTAKEMLKAFLNLYRNDMRSRRRRLRMALTAFLVLCGLLTGGAMTYVGLRRMERIKANQALAAESREALERDNIDLAIEKAREALPEALGLFDPPYSTEAQRALSNALGVYDLSDGYKPYKSIALTSPASGEAVKPVKAALSPDGVFAAVLVNELENWWISVYDVESGERVGTPLEAAPSATTDFLFTDHETILYAGRDGLVSFNLREQRENWRTNQAVTSVALSGDGSVAATVFRDETHAAIWDAHTGEALLNPQTGEPLRVDFRGRSMRLRVTDWVMDMKYNLFALDAVGDRLAVSFDDKTATLYDLRTGEETAIFDPGETDCSYFEGGFYKSFLAVSAYNGTQTMFLFADLSSGRVIDSVHVLAFHIQTDESGVYLSRPSVSAVSKLDPSAWGTPQFVERTLASVGTKIDSFRKFGDRVLVRSDEKWLLYDADARLTAQLDAPFLIDYAAIGGENLLLVNRDTPSLLIQRWERNPESVQFTYDPAFTHLEANVNSDGETALIFLRDRFIIMNRNGASLTPEPINVADAEQVRDEQYRRTGTVDRLGDIAPQDYLEVWYYDGLIRGYSVKDGGILFEKQGPIPDTARNEEVMETKDFRVVAPVNGAPEVYDKASGEQIGVLEFDGSLMYAYQAGEYLIAQYMSLLNYNERFGVLLDRNLQALADLPGLTDVLPDGTLVFDDTVGNLRESRIYSIEDLIAWGKAHGTEGVDESA